MKTLIDFLQQLAKNNNKEWFDAHKEEYQAAKKVLVTEVPIPCHLWCGRLLISNSTVTSPSKRSLPLIVQPFHLRPFTRRLFT